MYTRQLIFLRKSDCLGCAVLLCLVVCVTLLASSFLPSHLSLTCTYMYVCAAGVPGQVWSLVDSEQLLSHKLITTSSSESESHALYMYTYIHVVNVISLLIVCAHKCTCTLYIAAKLVLVQVAEKVLTSDVYKMKEPVQKLVHNYAGACVTCNIYNVYVQWNLLISTPPK